MANYYLFVKLKGKIIFYLNVIFPNGVPHEHGVEGGHLIDPHPRHPDDLSHVVHGRDGQPASILPLSKVKERDNLDIQIIDR